MAGRAQLRASDADRDNVAERLRKAAGEGRLRTEELEDRVELALSARTYGQLQRLVEDLPGRSLTVRSGRERLARLPRQAAVAAIALIAIALVLALLAGALASLWLWIAAAWLLFGRHGRGYAGRRHRHRRRLNGCWPERSPIRADDSAGHWV
jgi:Flp pilus assembly protein TadB